MHQFHSQLLLPIPQDPKLPKQLLRYLAACPQPLYDVALLLLDTGLRLGEALTLRWADVHLEPSGGARYGYVFIRDGKSKYAKRPVFLTSRAKAMLMERRQEVQSVWVFSNPKDPGHHYAGSTLDHHHVEVRRLLGLSEEFVLHSLRHTYLTRLGNSGADAFTIMRLAGHHSVTVSQRYVHPDRLNLVGAVERMEAANEQTHKALAEACDKKCDSDQQVSRKLLTGR